MDNVNVTPGTGATVAADDVGGVLYQRMKPAFGDDGSATDASLTNPFPVRAPDGTVPAGSPFSVTSAATLFDVDTSGYSSLVVQITSAGTSSTITYEASNDGSTWFAASGFAISPIGQSPHVLTSTTATVLGFNTVAKRFRARVSTYGSGTVTVHVVLRTGLFPPAAVYLGGSISIPVIETPTSAAGSALTSARIKAAASTNATNAKSSAAAIYEYTFSNPSAAAKFVKFYDKSSAPVVGTDTPFFTVLVPAGQTVSQSLTYPKRFASGLSYAITGAVGDTDTTAVAIDDVTGSIGYV